MSDADYPTAIRYDAQGLVPVIALAANLGEVRMLAYADAAAVQRTLETGKAHFFSRSRGMSWMKGESSGHVLHVHEVWADCDADTLLYLVSPEGPSCHTGRQQCFFHRVQHDGTLIVDESMGQPFMRAFWEHLVQRGTGDDAQSYTRRLLEKGPDKVAAKIEEEGGELAAAVRSESAERVVSEAADVIYHLSVGLLARGVSLDDVVDELRRRFGTPGLVEKASR